MSDGEVRPFLRKTYQNLFQISLDISPECFIVLFIWCWDKRKL